MLGLMLLGVFAIYLMVSVFVTKKAVSWAKANGKRPWLWGGLAAFVMYNLVFWDWIPTVVAHKYYCATEAGFTVYKTPEQWKQENPELTGEDLKTFGEQVRWGSYVNEPRWSFPFQRFEDDPERSATMINKRIYLDGEIDRNFSGILPIRKKTNFIADTKNDQKLAEKITFGSGYRDPMGAGGLQGFKYWLVNNSCDGNNNGIKTEYSKYIDEIVNLGEEK